MKYGLIGEHLKHSYSCEIHSMIAGYKYELCELRPEELGEFLTKRDFCAINVTIPFKEAVIPYLDEISDIAKEIGAVNTIVNRNGKLYGTNTDYFGMIALANRMGIDGKGKKFMILGSGGTSKTARLVCKNLNAQEIVTVSRTASEGYVTYEEAITKHLDTDYIINTTPAGMYPNLEGEPIYLDGFTKLKAVLDVVYNPLRTNLVLDASSRGIVSEGGLFMLAAQAVYAKAVFLDEEVRTSDIEKAFSKVREQKENIVLIGMPSSGKTTIGRLLSEKTDKEFIDTDEIILDRIKMPITDFFRLYGEETFRKIENQVIEEISVTGGKVIATGGGAILNPDNVRKLKQNGSLVFLDRDVEKLTATFDRPLALNYEALTKLYNERYDIYVKAADISVDGNDDVDTVLSRVLEGIKTL